MPKCQSLEIQLKDILIRIVLFFYLFYGFEIFQNKEREVKRREADTYRKCDSNIVGLATSANFPKIVFQSCMCKSVLWHSECAFPLWF